MNEETFNLELRRFLKKFGVTAQREIEAAVRAAIEEGRLSGGETLSARAAVRLESLPDEIVVDGTIALQ